MMLLLLERGKKIFVAIISLRGRSNLTHNLSWSLDCQSLHHETLFNICVCIIPSSLRFMIRLLGQQI